MIEWDDAALDAHLHEAARPRLLGAARDLVSAAQRLAPVDTGYLREHIHVEDEYGDAVSVVSEADYSIYQEFGTYKMAAHPFMRPALTEVQAKYA